MSADLAPRTAAITQWGDDFRRLVKQTVLKPKERDATGAELALLAEQSIRTGLDPMSRQIYGIYRKSRGQEVMTLQVGIDGLRSIAERTGSYLGQSGPFWCGDDGVWHECWLSKSAPRAAKVIVRKAIGAHIAETPAVAHYDEYVPMVDEWVDRQKTGKKVPSGLWDEKPALMLAKCAEALALRKAFPQDMSGLYTDDEMAKTDVKAQPAPVPTPAPAQPELVDAVVVETITDDEAAAIRADMLALGMSPRAGKAFIAAVGAASLEAMTAEQATELRGALEGLAADAASKEEVA